jgi:hypothetical protein
VASPTYGSRIPIRHGRLLRWVYEHDGRTWVAAGLLPDDTDDVMFGVNGGSRSEFEMMVRLEGIDPLPCGPEPHRGVSTAVRMVVADAPPYSARALPVRDTPDWSGASLGICDPVVIPDEPLCRSGVITDEQTVLKAAEPVSSACLGRPLRVGGSGGMGFDVHRDPCTPTALAVSLAVTLHCQPVPFGLRRVRQGQPLACGRATCSRMA